MKEMTASQRSSPITRPNGAAASIVILLIWVYYSAQIVLFGAELTHAYANEIGSRRTSDANAELPHKAAV
jgi:membrane protein